MQSRTQPCGQRNRCPLVTSRLPNFQLDRFLKSVACVDQTMPSLSIIVPVLNEAATIEQFLQQLRARVGAVEILLVDGGSSDDTRVRAANLCDRILTAKSSRALQMNVGAEAASSDILWFLHADCEVPESSLEEIERALRDPVTVGGFFRIRIPRPELVYRLTDEFGHYAGLLLRMRFGDHGFFCRHA